MKKSLLVILLILLVVSLVYAEYVPGTVVETRDTSPARDTRSLDPLVQETGLISWSIDGLGTVAQPGVIQVEKPAGATVRIAYLFAASMWSGGAISDGEIQLDSDAINWDGSIQFANSTRAWNYYADVTNLVTDKINNAVTGRIDFDIYESRPNDIDGTILAVIFDDPNQPEEQTIAFMFGAQDINGDQFNIGLADPVDANTEVFMSLGISYGFQPGDQVSEIKVNNQTLTTSAGGQDDSDVYPGQNGSLLTVGGLDDDYANPADPNAGDDQDIRYDDELYTLTSFLNIGDTQITVDTINPSRDDNIFFAAFNISGAAIIGQGCVLSPSFAVPAIGDHHIITATLQDDNGNPVVGKQIVFLITSGPHVGTTFTGATNTAGQVDFAYLGEFEGTDLVEASFINDENNTQMAENIAEVVWVDPDQLPVELSSFSGTFDSNLCSSTLSWTTQSESENMGWNIYRSTSTGFDNSQQLNAIIIAGSGSCSEPTHYNYQDTNDLIPNSEYRYWLECLSFDGEAEQIGPIVVSTLSEQDQPDAPDLVTSIGLQQNYPNPFNPDTQISFLLDKAGLCDLTIYDIKGRIVSNVFRGNVEAKQRYTVTWDGRDNNGKQVASGIYLYKLKSSRYVETRKMILMK